MAHFHVPGKQTGLEVGPLFIQALSARLGEERLTVDTAIKEGVYEADRAERDGYTSLRRTGCSVQHMIDRVAEDTMEQSGLSGEDLQLVTFSSIHDHGHRKLWQPAAYIQKIVGAKNTLAFSINHGCNGLSIGLIQATFTLMATGGNALLVAADRFELSGFQRWNSDQGLAYGDAGTGLILGTKKTGLAEVLYADTEFLPDLEEMHRMPDAAYGSEPGWNITETKRAFIERYGSAGFFQQIENALVRLRVRLKRWLAAYEKAPRAVVTPFVGRSVSDKTYARYFHGIAEINASQFGASVGHTGTSDQFIGLAHLLDTQVVQCGDTVVLVSSGAGFSISVLVLLICQQPSQRLCIDLE